MSGARRLVPGVVLAAALALPPTAAAGTAGAWSPVGTTEQLDISDLASLARTSDGALHVAWHRRIRATGGYDLLTTPVSARGVVGASLPAVTGWSSVGGPTLLAQGTTLTLFSSGTPTTVTGDPQFGLNLATSADGGRSWSVAPIAIAVGDFVAARHASVAAVASTFVQSWYAGRETVVHVGLDGVTPNQRGYGDGANQAVASDGTTVVAAWCVGVQGPNGVFVQPVDPATGVPAAPAARMPGSTVVRGGVAEGFCPASTRVPLVARTGGGYYVVSTDADRRAVRIWRVGAAASATLAAGSVTKQHLALAGAPEGRLWVGWIQDGKLRLRRSNRSATAFGAVVTVKAPPGSGGVYALDIAAQGDRVDAVARTKASSGEVALYHTQSYPGLSLSATGGRRATFRVTDAGDPVAGARVRVGGRSLTTNARGRAVATLPPGRYTATASKARYVRATASVRILRPPAR